jgi:hypothetical protein
MAIMLRLSETEPWIVNGLLALFFQGAFIRRVRLSQPPALRALSAIVGMEQLMRRPAGNYEPEYKIADVSMTSGASSTRAVKIGVHVIAIVTAVWGYTCLEIRIDRLH